MTVLLGMFIFSLNKDRADTTSSLEISVMGDLYECPGALIKIKEHIGTSIKNYQQVEEKNAKVYCHRR